jgi:PKD repeat protein
MTRSTATTAIVRAALLSALLAPLAFAATNALPVANASPDRSAATNAAVAFDGSASWDPDGAVAAYWWQFGDGGSVTTNAVTTSHAYAAPGVYTIVLWVRDDDGGWSAAPDTATVTVGSGTPTTTVPPTTTTTLPTTNLPPLAIAGPNQSAQTLVALSFDGSASYDPDGRILLAQWAFGDGTTAGGFLASHQYATPGTYTATFRVLDDDLALAADSVTVTVLNRAPIADAGPALAAATGVGAAFDGSASVDLDGRITGYAWSFGDGTTGSGVTPTHAYAVPGTYTAALTVTDDRGARATDTTTVTVATASATWQRRLGADGSDSGYAVAGDGAGNTFVVAAYRDTIDVGGTTFRSAGGADALLAKYSPTGAVLWARSMGGAGDDFAEGIAVDGAGDAVVVGRFAGTAGFGGSPLVASGSFDMVVAKYTGTSGAHQWSRRFGGAYDDDASVVAVDAGRNVYVSGYFRGAVDFGGGVLRVPYETDLDVFLLKLTAAGGHVWSKHFPNSGNERAYGLAVDGAGYVVLAGSFSNTVDFGGGGLTSPNALTDAFVARFTGAGAHVWSRRLGAPDGNEAACAVATDSAGNVVVAGYAIAAVDFGGGLLSALGGTDAFVARYAAANGAHLWSRRLGGKANDYAYGVAVGAGDAVFVTGAVAGSAALGGTTITVGGPSDGFVAKYSAVGAPAWGLALGGSDADVGRAISAVGGSPVVTGYFYGTGTFGGGTLASAGAADGFVVRLAP